jgi:hypothetical protein
MSELRTGQAGGGEPPDVVPELPIDGPAPGAAPVGGASCRSSNHHSTRKPAHEDQHEPSPFGDPSSNSE